MLPSSSSSSDQILESTQIPKLRNAFKLFKSHACKVANFTLQWQELEDHLRFIHSEIESKLPQNPTTKTIQNLDKNPPSKDLILPQIKNPETKLEQKPPCKSSEIPVKNGRELIFYIKEHVKNHILLQANLFKLFKAVDEPEKLVLEAVKESCSFADNDIRRSCVVLLEEFGRMRDEEVDDMAIKVREEAKRFAFEWKGKLEMENSLVVWGFLLLLIDFGLVGEFGYDEIFKLLDCVSSRKQEPELFRALGLADKAHEYIQRLIAKNRRLEAVRFVYAFKLVDQFPPVPLLKGHAKYAKNVATEICKKGKNSFKALSDATNREIAALRGIRRCIENYNLGSEYSSKMLRKQILRMKKQIKERKANTKPLAPMLLQQNNGNKRSAPAPWAERNQRRVRRKQTADLNASVDDSLPVNSKQPSLHQPTTSFAGQGAQNSTLPPRTDAPSHAVPYTCVVATSNAHIQHSPDQAALLLSHLSTVAHHSTSSFASTIPITSYTSVPRPYEFAGSATIRPQTSSSPGLYERSVATKGSSGQFGLAGSETIRPHTSSSPGLYKRSVATTSSSGQFGLAGSTTIRPHTSSFPGLYERSVATNSSSGQFGLAGSATIRPHTSSSPRLYERGVATNGSSGQFGLAGSATIRPHTSSMPGLYERGVSTNSSSEQFGLAGSATIHPHTNSMPGLYERGVSTNGSSEQFGLASSATIRLHTSLMPGPYERGISTNGSSGQFGLAGSATIRPHTSSSPRLYERSVATNGSSGQFGLAGSATSRPYTSSMPGLYERGVATNGSSGQLGLATTHTPMAGASNASTNITFPYYGDQTRTSMYYNRQASSSNTGFAPPNTSFNRSGYYDRPVSGGNYGVSSKFPPSIYHP